MKKYDTDRLNNFSILTVAEQLGIHVGRNKKMLCFIHSEKTPSLSFDVGKNRWRCFGCGASGGVIDLVMRYNNVGFDDACEWLEKAFGVNKVTNCLTKNSTRPQPKAVPPKMMSVDTSLYSAIVAEQVLSNKAANYLCKTRALSMNVVQENHIVSIDNISAFYKSVTSTYGEERLLRGGFLKTSHSGELKRNWWQPGIIFPYYAYNGEIANLQLRPYSESHAKYIFLNGISTAMYNEHLLRNWNNGDAIYLCEGAMDALSLTTKGYNAVGIPGVSSFQDAWIDYIGRFNITILFDNDDAGKQNAKTLKARLSQKNINVQVKHIPNCYKDINEMLLAEGDKDNVNS